MFCHKCGSQNLEDASFCQKCGTKLISDNTEQHKEAEIFQNAGEVPVKSVQAATPTTPTPATGSSIGSSPSITKKLESAKKKRKSVARIVSVCTTIVCLLFTIEYAIPGGVANIVGQLTTPGAKVRGAYLSQYSNKITIEDAFDNYFSSGKWSTYKAEGDLYVVFNGICLVKEERANAKITFKVLEETFGVDSLEINGQRQNDFTLSSLLSAVYEDAERSDAQTLTSDSNLTVDNAIQLVNDWFAEHELPWDYEIQPAPETMNINQKEHFQFTIFAVDIEDGDYIDEDPDYLIDIFVNKNTGEFIASDSRGAAKLVNARSANKWYSSLIE